MWAWFHIDRERERRGILFLADEVSEQDLHGEPYTVESLDRAGATLTVARGGDGSRVLRLAPDAQHYSC